MSTTLDYVIQEMSLKAIRVDHALQSRVDTNIEHVREYAEALGLGAIFPPVDVFYDGKDYWLVDGFHRHAAFTKAGRVSISARVFNGDKRAMILHSVGANLKMGIRPTIDDKAKALRMILQDEQLFQLSDTELGRRCGLSRKAAQKYRAEYCAEHGLQVPITRVDAKGIKQTPGNLASQPRLVARVAKGGNATEYRARLDGREKFLSRDKKEAENKLRSILREREGEIVSRAPLDRRFMFTRWLIRRQVPFIDHCEKTATGFPDIMLPGAIVRLEPNLTQKNVGEAVGSGLITKLAAAVGDVLLWRQAADPDLRAIIIAYPGPELEPYLKYAKQLGVEIMTPEEVVKAFKGKKFKAAESQPAQQATA